MAYNEQITTSSGYTADYWRLSEWTFNKLRGEVKATFRVYKDAATAAAGNLPASEQVAKIHLAGDEYINIFGPTRDTNKSDQQLIYEAATDIGVNSDFGAMEPTGKRKLFKADKKV